MTCGSNQRGEGDRNRVRFTPLGADATPVSIDLADVLHVERTRQAADGNRLEAVTD